MVADPLPDSYHVSSPHLGASKIATYLKCPRMYWFNYVEKLPVPGSPHAALGRVIHEVVRQAHAARWTPQQAPLAAASLAALWEAERENTNDPHNPEVEANALLARDRWLPWYLHFISGQQDVCVEEMWVLELADGVTLQGTFDRVYRDHGQTVLSDVKSGARKPSQYDLDRDLQLSIYAYALREMCLREDVLELVWLRTQETLHTQRTDEYLQAVMQQTVVPVARAIEAGVFPCNPGSKFGCGFCNYKSVCDIGRAE